MARQSKWRDGNLNWFKPLSFSHVFFSFSYCAQKQTNYFTWLIRSVRCFPFRIEVFTGCSQCRLHTKKKFSVYLAEVETDEDSDFDKEDNGQEDVLELNSSDHENFSEHYTELEEDGDSGNEIVMNSEWLSAIDGVQWRKTKFVLTAIILCRGFLDQNNQRKMWHAL
ncbi:hypothetical protein AVEN_225394-1 [Araneus ventricosus]|uniref:Uncharacterized protein n=1 Tax=Araneus ventricosus TaxID=182803 RepID=A0A4Y2HYF7_ARAVE|nr:hypothetical protein AVEN_225394-1 [Araneus ventricosus]